MNTFPRKPHSFSRIGKRRFAAIMLGGFVTISSLFSDSPAAQADPAPGLPHINSLSPASGTTSGGTRVTIKGDNLDEVVSVYFGYSKIQAQNVTPSSLVVVSPANSKEEVLVNVVDIHGQESNALTFKYISPT
jgi:hypothetical protein